MGRSRGGLTTKIHAVTDTRGLPIRLAITLGQDHDAPAAANLLIELQDGQIVLGDKAYDADWIRQQIEDQGAAPNLPDRSNRRQRHCFAKTLYKQRNLIERFFNKIRYFRRLAMRYDKLGSSFLVMLKLAAIRIWLRHNESMV
jgi:transposase